MKPNEAASLDRSAFRSWVKTASETDLHEVFDHMSPMSCASKWKIAETEVARRRHAELRKPHWTVLPNFWLTVVSVLAAVTAAYLSWLALSK